MFYDQPQHVADYRKILSGIAALLYREINRTYLKIRRASGVYTNST